MSTIIAVQCPACGHSNRIRLIDGGFSANCMNCGRHISQSPKSSSIWKALCDWTRQITDEVKPLLQTFRGKLILGVLLVIGVVIIAFLGDNKDKPTDADLAEKACNAGDMNKCVSVGRYHEAGVGGARKDYRLANDFYQKACDGGAANGCLHLGENYGIGRGVEKNTRRKNELFQKACNEGLTKVCDILRNTESNKRERAILTQAQGKDPRHARPVYEKLCNEGSTTACIKLEDLNQRHFYPRECEKGDPDACAKLAVGYERRNAHKRAKELHQEACQKGSFESCYNLGKKYADLGKWDEATPLYEKACDSASKWRTKNSALWLWHACDELAKSYRRGRGVRSSHSDALQIYQNLCSEWHAYGIGYHGPEVLKACKEAFRMGKSLCNGGDTNACMELGLMQPSNSYMYIEQINRIQFLDTACRGGEMKGCVEYGQILYDGGQLKDLVKAKQLFEKAANRGADVGDLPDMVKELLQEECRNGASAACYALD